MRRLGIRPKGDGHNEISLALPIGSRIVGLPGMRVSDDQYQAVTPMLAVGDGDLWLMSTPCGKRGFS